MTWPWRCAKHHRKAQFCVPVIRERLESGIIELSNVRFSLDCLTLEGTSRFHPQWVRLKPVDKLIHWFVVTVKIPYMKFDSRINCLCWGVVLTSTHFTYQYNAIVITVIVRTNVTWNKWIFPISHKLSRLSIHVQYLKHNYCRVRAITSGTIISMFLIAPGRHLYDGQEHHWMIKTSVLKW